MLFKMARDYADSQLEKRAQLSMEMIAEQKNDYVVQRITEQFQRMIDSGVSGCKNYFENATCADAIRNIDNLIRERFGIPAQHISGKGCLYACLPIAPIHNAAIDRTIEQDTKYIERMVNEQETNTRSSAEGSKIEDIYDDQLEIYKRLVDMRKQVTEHLKTDSIYIDLQHAKIMNLPKDYKAYFIADFHMCINQSKLTARELTAILFHEIGHVFTHLEYNNRIANTTQVLVDSVKEVTLKQNNGTKESLRLVYEKTTKSKVPSNFKNMKSTEAALFVATGIFNRNVNIQDHAYTDSEQLADQFSGRFGLGAELATGLTKAMHVDSGYGYFKMMLYTQSSQILTIIIFNCIMAIFTAGATLLFIPLFLMGMLAFTLFYAIFRKNMFASEDITSGMTYDDIKRRFQRIKNEVVRQLTSDLPKDIKSALLERIRLIEEQMNKVPEARKGIVEKIVLYFESNGDIKVNTKKAEQLLEDLMANELYIGSAYLNQIRS